MPCASVVAVGRMFPGGRWWLLFGVVAAQVVLSTDFSVITIALPAINRALAPDPALVPWLLAGDLLAYGGFLIVGGRLSDSYGQRPVMTWGLLGYLFGAAVCALSPTMSMLILGRAIQGLGAALAYPAALSLLTITFPDGPARVKALTISTAAQALGVPFATILAGCLVNSFGWPGVFFLPMPLCLGIVAVILLVAVPGEPRRAVAARIPLVSAALLVAGSSAFTYWAINAVSHGSHASHVLLSGFVALTVLALWVALERASDDPLIPRHVLSSRNLVPGLFITAVVVVCGKSMIVLANIALQEGLHETPIRTALVLLPMAVASIILLSSASARFTFKIFAHGKRSLAFAFIVLACCHLAFSISSPQFALISALVLLLVSPLASITGTNIAIAETLREVPSRDQGVAAALLYTAVQITGAVGTSVIIAAARLPGSLADAFSRFGPSFRVAAGFSALGLVLTVATLRQPPRHSSGP